MIKINKILAFVVLFSLLLTVFSACRSKEPTESEHTGDETTDGSIEPGGDTWMDIWDQDPQFQPLTNDAALDTRGARPDGSWFDSFQSKKNIFWNANINATGLTYQDGKMCIESSDNKTQMYVRRQITPAEDFEVEFRLRMDYYGVDNGMHISFNGVRAVMWFYETKLRFNMVRANEDQPRAEMVYVDVGYDWHTYRIRVHDRMASVYFDGVYLTSFVPEPCGPDAQFCFFTIPNNAYNAAKMSVEYASYTVLTGNDLQIVSPAGGAVCGSGNTSVTVACKLSDGLRGQARPVSFYLNDIYAGESDAADPRVTFEALTPGVYSVRAVCGDASDECIFVVEEAETARQKQAVYSDVALLQSSYVLKYRVSGDGSLSAGDGVSPFRVQHHGAQMTVETADGGQTLAAGSGDYIAVADSGIAWLYKNGRLLTSVRLPCGDCETTASATGAITGLTVEAHNGTLYRAQFGGSADLNTDPGYLGHNYAVEFVYTAGSPLALHLTDGAFLLDLRISDAGELRVLNAPFKSTSETILCNAPTGTALYRITVAGGIAQIFADHIWLDSWRLPESVASRRLSVSGEGIGVLRICETQDLFYYSGSPADRDWSDYFSVPATLPIASGNGSCLKVYSRNTTVTAGLELSDSTSGLFYLTARYFNGNGVIVGYDFDAGCFRVGEAVDQLKPAGQFALDRSKRLELKLTVTDNTAELFCNGVSVVSFPVSLNGWGHAGYMDCTSGAELVSFAYRGDGNPLCDTSTTLIPDDHTVGIFELDGKIYAGGERGTYLSTDGGRSFSQVADLPHRSYNMIVLQSGKLLSVIRTRDSSGLIYKAYLSSDQGKTYSGPYNVQSDYNDYRFTMNGKVMQTSGGRVFFVSGETEDENIGRLWIYYSDNEGVTWKKSRTEFTHATTGMNLQEGCIVELEEGILRMYARNDSGFLVYSESRDNGKTWDTNMKISNFASVVSAFNVTRDASTGAIWLAWEYNNISESAIIQYPRTRVALAVSYDNAKTWQYVGDFDEQNSVNLMTWVHMNIGVWVTTEAVFVTAAKKIGSRFYNYTVRIGKDSVIPSERFNSLHGPFSAPEEKQEGNKLFVGGVLAISARDRRVYASGEWYELGEVRGKRTMLNAEIVASFLHGTLILENGRAVIRVGNAEYIFTAGSDIAMIAGEHKQMTFVAEAGENGTVRISVEDLHRLLGLTARCSDSGAIVLTADASPVRLNDLLTKIGIW